MGWGRASCESDYIGILPVSAAIFANVSIKAAQPNYSFFIDRFDIRRCVNALSPNDRGIEIHSTRAVAAATPPMRSRHSAGWSRLRLSSRRRSTILSKTDGAGCRRPRVQGSQAPCWLPAWRPGRVGGVAAVHGQVETVAENNSDHSRQVPSFLTPRGGWSRSITAGAMSRSSIRTRAGLHDTVELPHTFRPVVAIMTRLVSNTKSDCRP